MGNFYPSAALAGVAHYHAACCVSTNSELSAAIGKAYHDNNQPVIYTATQQSGGRGQHGRAWLSPKGNAYLSFYMPIGQHGLIRLSGALALCVGLALQQMPMISTLNAQRASCQLPMIATKWVNDLGFYDPKIGLFCKLAGILIEPVFGIANPQIANSPSINLSIQSNKIPQTVGVVIGVGMNVGKVPVLDGLYQAISLHACQNEVSAHTTSLAEVYLSLSLAIRQAVAWHNQCTQDDGVLLGDELITAFNHAHALHHKTVAIYEHNAPTPSHIGICQGIGSHGTLLLQKPTGEQCEIWTGMAMAYTQQIQNQPQICIE